VPTNLNDIFIAILNYCSFLLGAIDCFLFHSFLLAFSQYVLSIPIFTTQSYKQTHSGPSSEFEFMLFATVGNNWPDFNEEGGEDEVESTPKQPQRMIWNPILRARNLIRRIL
ncbi:MAG: hypothetical protein ACI90V_011071, partial [Bacillariaceae sp.]|jgi:hypothetical protein